MTEAERRSGAIPRQIAQPCTRCGSKTIALNGDYFRNLRVKAKLTLVEMARMCGVTKSHLSRMERGDRPFLQREAEAYERLLERRRKAGDGASD